jgi:hypothetical protein
MGLRFGAKGAPGVRTVQPRPAIGTPNIWSKHELEQKRRKALAEARGPRRFMSQDDLFGGLVVGRGRGVAVADRIDNQGQRYTVLLMAVRTAHADWTAEAQRAEAQRLLRLEVPRR